MRTLVATDLQPQIKQFLDEVTGYKEVPLLVNSKGKKFVIIPEEDFRGWNETAYLLSSKKNVRVLKQALNQPLSECRDLKDVLNDLGR